MLYGPQTELLSPVLSSLKLCFCKILLFPLTKYRLSSPSEVTIIYKSIQYFNPIHLRNAYGGGGGFDCIGSFYYLSCVTPFPRLLVDSNVFGRYTLIRNTPKFEQ